MDVIKYRIKTYMSRRCLETINRKVIVHVPSTNVYVTLYDLLWEFNIGKYIKNNLRMKVVIVCRLNNSECQELLVTVLVLLSTLRFACDTFSFQSNLG